MDKLGTYCPKLAKMEILKGCEPWEVHRPTRVDTAKKCHEDINILINGNVRMTPIRVKINIKKNRALPILVIFNHRAHTMIQTIIPAMTPKRVSKRPAPKKSIPILNAPSRLLRSLRSPEQQAWDY